VQRQADLFEVVFADRPVGSLTHLLNGRQEQADEHGDDGHDDQKLNERKGRPNPSGDRHKSDSHWQSTPSTDQTPPRADIVRSPSDVRTTT
jgi:hypothetical protein